MHIYSFLLIWDIFNRDVVEVTADTIGGAWQQLALKMGNYDAMPVAITVSHVRASYGPEAV